MGFKPIRYNAGQGMAKIKLEDDTGRNIENWIIMMSDLTNWFKLMQRRYGQSICNKKDKEEHDLDWLK